MVSTTVMAFAAVVLVPVVLLLLASAFFALKPSPKGAPPVWSGGWPLIGHFHKFAGNPLGAIRQGYDALGPVFTMRFLNYNMTFLIGKEAHTPFFTGTDEFLDQNEPYKFMTPVFGEGVVFDAPASTRHQQLNFITHAFKGNVMRSYVAKIVDETEKFFAENWGESGQRDLLEDLSSLTLLTASRCLLGPEIRNTLFKEFSELFKKIDEGINPIAIFFPNAPLPAFRERDKARQEIERIFKGVIQARRRGETTGDDMLQTFIEAKYKDESTTTDSQITGMLIGTLFAGQHTSSITSTWTILRLLHSPALLKRALEEQTAVFNTADPANKSFELDQVRKCGFLENCMTESLRMAPPLIMLMRQVTGRPLDVTVRGKTHTVPVGHLVFAPLAVSMNLPDSAPDCVFKSPETFNPDRYVGNEALKKDHSFVAFGGGIHRCRGEQFGYMQVMTIVSMILRRYELEPVGQLPLPNHTAMVVGPLQTNNSCVVKYRLRKTPLPAPAGWAPVASAASASGAGAGAASSGAAAVPAAAARGRSPARH